MEEIKAFDLNYFVEGKRIVDVRSYHNDDSEWVMIRMVNDENVLYTLQIAVKRVIKWNLYKEET